jgi:hypothetical protein
MKLSLAVIFSLVCMMLGSLELQTGLGYDVMGSYRCFISEYDDVYFEVDNSFSPNIQLMLPIKSAKLGLGVEYQFRRLVDFSHAMAKDKSQQSGSMNFIPVYLVAQVPLNSSKTIFETITEFGISFNDGDESYRTHFSQVKLDPVDYYDRASLKFGLHAGIGFAIRSGKIAYQMIYKFDHGYYDMSIGRKRFVEYNHLAVGFRWDNQLKTRKH